MKYYRDVRLTCLLASHPTFRVRVTRGNLHIRVRQSGTHEIYSIHFTDLMRNLTNSG